MGHLTLAGEEKPAAEGAGSDQTLEATLTGALLTDHELGHKRAKCLLLPVSHKGLNPHQQRELRNLRLLLAQCQGMER